jgi:hypothetical protein
MSMHGRSIKLKRLLKLGVAAVVIPVAAMQFASPAATAAPAPAKGYYIAVSGVDFTPGKVYSPEQVQQMQKAGAR